MKGESILTTEKKKIILRLSDNESHGRVLQSEGKVLLSWRAPKLSMYGELHNSHLMSDIK